MWHVTLLLILLITSTFAQPVSTYTHRDPFSPKFDRCQLIYVVFFWRVAFRIAIAITAWHTPHNTTT
jgi:hypothetical protein